MEIFAGLIAGAVVLLLVIVLIRLQKLSSSNPDLQSVLLVHQQMESMRNDLRDQLRNVTESFNHQLGTMSQQMSSQSGAVGSRLDSAARIMGDVQRNLGDLGRATEELKELGRGVSKLEELLGSPKLRGGLGEYLLEDLLKQVLPSDNFEMQHRFNNGTMVDAIVRTSDRLVSIDSKFPLENFRGMVLSGSEVDRRSFQRAFAADVRKHIDAIAMKYILPDEGTFPFALMYIPSENIYYEIIIKDESIAAEGLYEYALARNVVPVSPNSFYAYLQVIAIGLRGLRVEQNARGIVDTLIRLQDDLTRLREGFDTLGLHLENARKKYDEVGKRFSNFEARLGTVGEHPAGTGVPQKHIAPGTVILSMENHS